MVATYLRLVAVFAAIAAALAQPGYIQDGLQWQSSGGVTPIPWMGRYGHSVAVTSTAGLLVIGGLINGTSTNYTGQASNTVVRSDNVGSTWEPVTTAPFAPRFYHSSTLTSTGTVLMIGGFALSSSQPLSVLMDTWYTVDGVTWSAGSQMPWSRGRGGHAVVADSTSLIMYVTGGLTLPYYQCLNDVWKTPDGGLTWQIATIHAPFAPRAFHGAVVRLGTLFVMGGANVDSTALTWTGINDVWTSVDQGSAWNQLAPVPYSRPRIMAAMICYNNDDIYLIGGVDVPKKFVVGDPQSLIQLPGSNVSSTVYNDVWLTSDAGLSWTQTNPMSVFDTRFSVAVAVLGQDLTILGGVNQQGQYLNDVWYTILPQDSSGSDGTILAAIIGTVSGIFLVFIIVLRRFQDKFAQVTVSGKTEKELLKAAV